jgi:Fe-S cluster assembly ATPase SufC
VHVLVDGRIVASGDADLAAPWKKRGFGAFRPSRRAASRPAA